MELITACGFCLFLYIFWAQQSVWDAGICSNDFVLIFAPQEETNAITSGSHLKEIIKVSVNLISTLHGDGDEIANFHCIQEINWLSVGKGAVVVGKIVAKSIEVKDIQNFAVSAAADEEVIHQNTKINEDETW